MTLSTEIYIHGEVEALDVFNYVVHQLLEFDRTDDGAPRTFGDVKVDVGADTDWRTKAELDTWTMQTVCGQGLPAWVILHYRPGGEYRTAAEAAEHDEDICNLPTSSWTDKDSVMCDGTDHRPACHLLLDLDTAYSYKGPNGIRCSDLHGMMIARLGAWLDERSISWSWQNEYTGEIHCGADGLEGLLRAGTDADRWFDSTALPAIQAHIQAAGERSADTPLED